MSHINWHNAHLPYWYALIPTENDLFKIGQKHKQFFPWPGLNAAAQVFMVDRVGEDEPFSVIAVNNDRVKDWPLAEKVALFTHEAVHIFEHLCRCIGEETPSEEFRAYFTQRITMNLWNDYAKYHKIQS